MTESLGSLKFPVRAVLFDLDGTLVDSLPGISYSLRAAVDQILPGAALPPAQTLIGPPVREMFRIALPIVNETTLGELESAFRRSYDGDGYLKTVSYPDAEQVLQTLRSRGILCYVVTNKPPEATRRVLSHLELAKYFTRVVSTGDWLPARITKAAATRRLLEQESLDARDCLFLGDSPDDVEAARANGLAFLAAVYGYGGVRAETNGALTALNDLTTLICPETSGAAR